MSFLTSIWLIVNLFLIVLILIRSPDEQSLQETLGPLKLFDTSGSGEKRLDQTILALVIAYFVIGFILTSKAF